MKPSVITRQNIEAFLDKLRADGKINREIAEYRRNLERLYETAEKNNYVLSHEILAEWRTEQTTKLGAAPTTVTNRTVKINQFLRFLELDELCFQKGGRQNLTNKRFGDLIAIEPVPEQRVGRCIGWKCRCMRCGKEKIIPVNQLNKGCQVSCGCNRATRLQRTNGYIEGTCLKNVFSDKISSNNISGYKGVFRKRGRWAACIQYKKKTHYLGSYDRLEDAVAARKEAEQQVREDAERLLEKMKETR